MFTIIGVIYGITAVYAGFDGWPLYWIPLLAVGLWLAELVSGPTYDITMEDIRREKLRAATVMFAAHYLGACIGASIAYGIGRLAGWMFS